MTGSCGCSGCSGGGGSDGGRGRVQGRWGSSGGGGSSGRDGGREKIPAGARRRYGSSIPTLKACLPVPAMGHVRVLMVGPVKDIITSAPSCNVLKQRLSK